MKISHQKYEQVTQQHIRNIEKFKHLADDEIDEILEHINTLAEMIYHQGKTEYNPINESSYLQAA